MSHTSQLSIWASFILLAGACGDATIAGLAPNSNDGTNFESSPDDSANFQPSPDDGAHFQPSPDGGTSDPSDIPSTGDPVEPSATPEPEPSAPTSVSSAEWPRLLVNQTEIEAIGAMIEAGEDPWASQYDTIEATARSYLSQGASQVSGTFAADPGYSGGCRSDASKLHTGKQRIQAIALAYAFCDYDSSCSASDKTKFASNGISKIMSWVNSMDPTGWTYCTKESSQGRLDISQNMPGIFWGMDLLWNASEWSSADKAAAIDWVRDLYDKVFDFGGWTPPGGNNWTDFRMTAAIAAAALIGDKARFDEAARWYAERLESTSTISTSYCKWGPSSCSSNADCGSGLACVSGRCYVRPCQGVIEGSSPHKGRMNFEFGRGEAGYGCVSYSLAALGSISEAAEVLRHNGVDGWKSYGGRGPEDAWQFLAYYVRRPGEWPWKEACIYEWDGYNSRDYASIAELVYNRTATNGASPDFVDDLEDWLLTNGARYEYNYWKTSYPTMTHARGAYDATIVYDPWP